MGVPGRGHQDQRLKARAPGRTEETVCRVGNVRNLHLIDSGGFGCGQNKTMTKVKSSELLRIWG